MTRTLFCDASFYQDALSTPYKPDFALLKTAGIQGIIMRHSQNGVLDRMFEWYWNESTIHVIPRMTYGLLQYWPGSMDSGKQGKFVGDWFGDKPKTRTWCDFERPRADYPALPSRQNCLDMIQNWMTQADIGTRMESGLYTNLDTIKYLSPIPSWLLQRPFWLSWPVAAPAGVSVIEFTRNMIPATVPFPRRVLWQFTWVGPGEQAGFESKGLDGDWFEGDLAEALTFCGEPIPAPVPVPVPSPTNNAKIKSLVLELSELVKDL